MTYRTGDERPVLNIEGELVALGPLRRDLLPLYQRWINDLVAARGLGAFRPITVEKETGAARACRDYGFGTLGYDRLVSLIDPSNLASRRVAEKVGMRLEKHTHKWGKKICVYAIEDLKE